MPEPDHGEKSYKAREASGRRALITGGDSGIGRAVAIAFAREGADVAIAHLPEEQRRCRGDRCAGSTRRPARKPRPARRPARRGLLRRDRRRHGRRVRRARHPGPQRRVPEGSQGPRRARDRANSSGSSGRTSTRRSSPRAPRCRTSARCVDHRDIVDPGVQSVALADRLRDDQGGAGRVRQGARRGARTEGHPGERGGAGSDLDSAHPGDGMGHREARTFGQDTPLGRAGQPAELAGAYVYLASDDASYVSGAVLPVTGGKGL